MRVVPALALAAAVAACGSDGGSSGSDDGGSGEDHLDVIVLVGGPATDGGFFQEMVDGMRHAAEEDGDIEVAVRERLLEGGDAALESAVRQAAQSGDYDLVIAHGFDLVPAVATVAPDYPDQAFATSLPVQGDPPNASVYLTDFEDSGYSAGFLAGTAAASTGADRVGFISGPGQDFERQTEDGFRAAVEDYAPGTEIDVVYTGDFDDPQLGQEAAGIMIDDGVDVIWNLLSGGQSGVFRACEEAGPEVLCFGNGTFSEAAAPDVVLGSNYSDYATLLPIWAERLRAGEWSDGDQPYTDILSLESGGVAVTDASAVGRERLPDLQDAIDEFRTQALAGEVEVPDSDVG
ncbi:MAG TPA: BMP family ABC transporter substrate-binding protein [Acidimicrobiales bacterium]